MTLQTSSAALMNITLICGKNTKIEEKNLFFSSWN